VICVVVQESGIDAGRAAGLVRLGGAIRRLSGMDLEEGVSTRLLIHAASLINSGMSFDAAIEVAVIQPLSDTADIQQALRDLVAVTFG
jgi:nitric oxide reductase NorQ protein